MIDGLFRTVAKVVSEEFLDMIDMCGRGDGIEREK